MSQLILRDIVREIAIKYISDLDGETPMEGLHRIFIDHMDYAVYKFVYEHCSKNQSNATKALGVSRATFRKKLINLRLHNAANS